MSSDYNIPVKENRGFRAQRGFSLIEIMVALLLISGAALIISQFSTTFKSQPPSLRRACESYTSSLIGIVQEETLYQRIINDFLPSTQTGNSRMPPYQNRFTTTRAIPNENASYLRPAGNDRQYFRINEWGSARNGSYMQSFQLIQGSIHSLAAIYNNNPGIRCRFGTYDPITSTDQNPLPSTFLNNPGIRVRMRIDPYRISTGRSLCRPEKVYPGPRPIGGMTDTSAPGSGSPNRNSAYWRLYQIEEKRATSGASDPSRDTSLKASDVQPSTNSTITQRRSLGGGIEAGDPDLGLRLTVELRYSSDGQNYTCQSSHGFEYPVDRRQPPPPFIRITENNAIRNSSPGLWDHCARPQGLDENSGRIMMQIGYDLNSPQREPGVQFMCKDLSFIREVGPQGTAICITRIGDTSSFRRAAVRQPLPRPLSSPLPPPSTTRTMSTTENSRQFQSRAGDKKEREAHWVPCDQLRVCGKAPSTVGATVNPTGGNRYLTLEYEDLPFGCNINAEVVAVDTAGNRSSVETPTFVIRNENPSDPYGHLAANRITVTQSSLRFSTWFNEVYYPTCGNSGPDYVPGLGVLCENEDNLGNIGNHYYTCRTTNHFNSGVSGYRSSYRAGKPAFHNRCCDGEGCRPWN